MRAVYRDLFEHEYRFTPRAQRPVASVVGTGWRRSYIEVACGALPSQHEFGGVAKSFESFFEPQVVRAEGGRPCWELARDYETPLALTAVGIETAYTGFDDLSVFVFDPGRSTDLIELWNMRLIQRSVLPVSLDDARAFPRELGELMAREYRPLPGNHSGVMLRAELVFARSVGGADRAEIAASLASRAAPGEIGLGAVLDPISAGAGRAPDLGDEFVHRPRMVRLSAGVRTVSTEAVGVDDLTVAFEPLTPRFARGIGRDTGQWVNVIKLWSASLSPVSDVMPHDHPALPLVHHSGGARSTRGGLAVPLAGDADREWIRLPRSDAVVSEYLSGRGFSVAKSDAGRIAEQMLHSLGGVAGAHILEHLDTLNQLDRMARSVRPAGVREVGEYTDRSAPAHEWKRICKRRNEDRRVRPVDIEDFVDAGVLRLGVSVKCPVCTKRNWYGIAELAVDVECERCRRKYQLPQGALPFDPKTWQYRAVGPFAVPDYAQGSYSVALALRVFGIKLSGSHSQCVYSTGLLLDNDHEVDFACLFSRESMLGMREEPLLVLGEAKSCGKQAIREKDVARLKALAERMPGAFLVFVVLKDQLSADEVNLVRRLAEWGRKRSADGHPRAPVIILTTSELFSDWLVTQAWDKSGSTLSGRGWVESVSAGNLYALAAVTQLVHLGLDPVDPL